MRKSNKMNRAVACSLMAAMVLAVNPMVADAYGETSENSTLVNDTQEESDYQTWYSNTWYKNESADSGKIVLTPGATAADLNFAWYSEEVGTPQVKIGKQADLSDGVVYKGTATEIERSNWSTTYYASNKVSVEGVFAENTAYYYSYSTDGTTWSEAEEYTTKSTEAYKILLVGDPQTGASGSNGQGTDDDINIAVDTYNWNKTLETAAENDGDASFILSVGDQIDYSNTDDADTSGVRESEYAGFLYPSLLRNLPLATSIGNHESKGTDYSYHYNNPNSEDGLGATNSGSDYYFSYGDVLYIILNSNNRNAAEHSELMEKAIASNPDAKWKVVAFHHDIYGSGQPHSDTDGANLRTIFAPLMDEYDIDICVTGHDHSYARTYQIIDGTAIEYGENSAVDPEGTLYVAAGSASGSKFYKLATLKQYYIAERSNTQYPTYSTIEFSDNELTIKTYDYNGDEYAEPFTIQKTGSKESAQALVDTAEALDSSLYTTESYQRVQLAVIEMNKIIARTGEDEGAAALIASYDATLDSDNTEDLLTYYAYATDGGSRLEAGFSTLLDYTTLSTLTKSMTAKQYEAAYNELNASLQALQSVAEENNSSTDSTDDTSSDSSSAGNSSTVKKKATLTLKKGSKKLTSGTVVKLKKGKSFQIKAVLKNSSSKITYKSSNKKAVKVSSSGKVTAKKVTKKAVKITVKAGSLKKTFKVKVQKK